MTYQLRDARTFLGDNNWQAVSTRDGRIVDKCANDGNMEFHSYVNWDFDMREKYYALEAQDTTGTVSINIGSGTCTGVGTAFAASYKGRYIRFNGEYTEYLITAYSSPTSITVQTNVDETGGYLGAANLSGATFQIVSERIALPDDFKTIYGAKNDYSPTPMSGKITREQILYNRAFIKEVSYPRYFCTTNDRPLTGSTISNYLLLYPAIDSKRLVHIFYYAWPAEATLTTDEFGVGNQRMPFEAEPVLRQFQLYKLKKEQGDPNWQAEQQTAFAMADELQGDRGNADLGQKEQWLPNNNGLQVPFGNWLKAGQLT